MDPTNSQDDKIYIQKTIILNACHNIQTKINKINE